MYQSTSHDPEPYEKTTNAKIPTMNVDSMRHYVQQTKTFDVFDAETEQKQAHQLIQYRKEYILAVFSHPIALRKGIEIAPELFEKPASSAIMRAFARQIAYVDKHTTAGEEHQQAKKLAIADDILVDELLEIDPGATLVNAIWQALGGEKKVSGESYRKRVLLAKDAYTKCRNQFLCANLRLVITIAKRYGSASMSLADRVQEGNLGLLKAVERFDPERGVRFATYAGWWIRHSVLRALLKQGRMVRIPVHIHSVFTKLQKAHKLLSTKLQREPTLEEISTYVEVPLEKLQLAVEAMKLRSISTDFSMDMSNPYTWEKAMDMLDILPTHLPEPWHDSIEAQIDACLVQEKLSQLNATELDIVLHRFGLQESEQSTLQSLGTKYDLSRERIRQLQNQALNKLHKAVETSDIPSIMCCA